MRLLRMLSGQTRSCCCRWCLQEQEKYLCRFRDCCGGFRCCAPEIKDGSGYNSGGNSARAIGLFSKWARLKTKQTNPQKRPEFQGPVTWALGQVV